MPVDPITAMKAAQAALAAGQIVSGAVNKHKSDKMSIASTDPTQTMAYNNIKARSRAIRTGTIYARAVRDLNSGNKTSTAGAFKSGFAMRSAINAGQSRYNEGVIQLSAIADNAWINNETLLERVRTRNEQRKIEVGILSKKEKEANATANLNTGLENGLGILASKSPVKDSGGSNDGSNVSSGMGSITNLIETFKAKKQAAAEAKSKQFASSLIPDEPVSGDILDPEQVTEEKTRTKLKKSLVPDEVIAPDEIQSPPVESSYPKASSLFRYDAAGRKVYKTYDK